MIILNNTNNKIEEMKQRLGLTGDVYLYNEHFMESLESHKKLLPNSTATTIEEAYNERVAYEKELEEKRKANVENMAEIEEE